MKVVVGKPIPREEIDAFRTDGKAMMDFLRLETYALSPKPLKSTAYGFEFEDRWKA